MSDHEVRHRRLDRLAVAGEGCQGFRWGRGHARAEVMGPVTYWINHEDSTGQSSD
jgi:hypothetical protein